MGLNFKSRRGMTLAEIMVALGLVAIMIVMVVSFVLLMSERTQANSKNLEVQQDRAVIKSGVEAWLAAVTKENAALSLQAADSTPLTPDPEENGLTITRPDSDAAGCKVLAGDNLTLSFAYGVLKGQLPDGKTITVHAQSVESMDFYLVEKQTGGEPEYLLYCVATGEQGNYTFCVDPRVGEKGGAF